MLHTNSICKICTGLLVVPAKVKWATLPNLSVSLQRKVLDKRQEAIAWGHWHWQGGQNLKDDSYGVCFQGFVPLFSSTFHPRVAPIQNSAAEAGSKDSKRNPFSWTDNCKKRPLWIRQCGVSFSLFSLLTCPRVTQLPCSTVVAEVVAIDT